MEIPDLLARYNLNSRSSLYKRLKAAGLELSKSEDNRVFANTDQLCVLDDLHKHLKNGGKLSNYSPVYDAHVMSVIPVGNGQYGGLSAEQETSSIELLEKLVGAIATSIQPVSPVIKKHQELHQAMENSWLLTSKDIQLITGRKPARKGGISCQIGGWRFLCVGKSGNQLLWKVEKLKL
ncbi:MAG: hypothetical protein F6K17_04600 [Okeania sp. SIO3C4]|nr:hypothetical protein [Okeania sp. SIO3C4]